MDEAGSWDNLRERFEVKRINHQEDLSMDDACMTEALASKTCTLCRGEYLHSRASKLSSFTRRPQTGNCRRKLTTSGGASGFAISARRLPSFQISAN